MADDAIRFVGMDQLVAKLKESPDRLDKAMRKELAGVSKDVRDAARSRAQGAHPRGDNRRVTKGKGKVARPKHGAYTWDNLVNTIVSGAESDRATVGYGRDNIPGWAGWEFGSTKFLQFPPRTPRVGAGNQGRFFWPAVREEVPKVASRIERIVEDYFEEAFPD